MDRTVPCGLHFYTFTIQFFALTRDQPYGSILHFTVPLQGEGVARPLARSHALPQAFSHVLPLLHYFDPTSPSPDIDVVDIGVYKLCQDRTGPFSWLGHRYIYHTGLTIRCRHCVLNIANYRSVVDCALYGIICPAMS